MRIARIAFAALNIVAFLVALCLLCIAAQQRDAVMLAIGIAMFKYYLIPLGAGLGVAQLLDIL